MYPVETILRARRVVTPEGSAARWVGVRGGRIVAVEPYDVPPPTGARVIDLGADEALLPGLVDTHVHINEPGRTEWEGFASATRAAAAGGVTTLIDMPLNSIPPTVDVDALEAKRAFARGAVAVDVGFWGGAVPGNRGELRGLHEAGVFGFKCFLLDSGVEEFPPLGPDELLWQGLTDGMIDIVVSDHSPSTPELKRLDTGDFGAAWGGISSLQLGLTAIWSQARARGHTLDDVVAWMASGPAALAGLTSKGRIAVGADADFCVFAPDETCVVDPLRLQHRHPVTPYRGRALLGQVRETWLRGKPVDLDAPRGDLLRRGDEAGA